MLSNRVTETVTAALKGENKAPTSVRGWQERSRLVGEGVREERGGDTVQGQARTQGLGNCKQQHGEKRRALTEANRTAPQRRKRFCLYPRNNRGCWREGKMAGTDRGLFVFCAGCSEEPV